VGQILYTSATPAAYERGLSTGTDGQTVEQIIRPTGLLDPALVVRPIVSGGDYAGQVQDFIAEAQKVVRAGERALVTTLTKKMAEDLAEYLRDKKVKAEYLHSDIKTIERIDILSRFRQGEFDVLVGVNLLREGLDLPEVSLVGILDADKEGFLRSETSLIQTIGRAARNVHGRVLLYADAITDSMRRAIDETERRRAVQAAYNKKHKITPKTIQKAIRDITAEMRSEHQKAVSALLTVDRTLYSRNPKAVIKEKTRQMNEAVRRLDFETAALLRDEIKALERSEENAVNSDE
jgi:excinuclease ABC subunit B